ncbi:MAG: prepilin-type N-terminal cleavage/methylation domain-containing protein [Candidatus Pacebacteria bacterium]|nr:prepilin-type N-terminal cleavage/methylation domain-containing protein [Candidatus Paceibacterota bacterium]
MFKNFHKIKYNKGVTLVELLVVIFIFVIISGITIFDYGKFRSSLSIQNLADDIALSVRKAQGYAIGVHSTDSVFDVGYGVHFTVNPLPVGTYSGTNKAFILFADMDVVQNKMYDYNTVCGAPTTGSECLEVLNIASTDKILGIKYYVGGYLVDKTLPATGTLDIVFKRPNPEPVFCYKSAVTNTSCDAMEGISYIQIILATSEIPVTTKTVTISNNGQISVSN